MTKPRVLIVDDDAQVCFVATRSLESIAVRRVHDVAEATLRLAHDTTTSLPRRLAARTLGMTLLDELRRRPRTAALMLSGGTDWRWRRRHSTAAQGYVVKPFQYEISGSSHRCARERAPLGGLGAGGDTRPDRRGAGATDRRRSAPRVLHRGDRASAAAERELRRRCGRPALRVHGGPAASRRPVGGAARASRTGHVRRFDPHRRRRPATRPRRCTALSRHPQSSRVGASRSPRGSVALASHGRARRRGAEPRRGCRGRGA